MMQLNLDRASLWLNFPQTFLPDRQLLARLLAFAGGDCRSGDKIEIGKQTGIPTGESTGKVEPMIHYCRGMGLVNARKTGNKWQLGLTEVGRRIYSEDRFLNENVTLWLLHLLMCRGCDSTEAAGGVAPAWFTFFVESHLRLSRVFRGDDLAQVFVERFGMSSYIRGLASLVVRMYLEKNCFRSLGVLTEEEIESDQLHFHRHPAPVDVSFFPAYSVFLFDAWDELFPDTSQVEMDILFGKTSILKILGWDASTAMKWLEWMADNGMIQLDRQTGNTLGLRLQETTAILQGLFDELL